MGKCERMRERWLLTRKTWRYMTDAKRLLPSTTDTDECEKHFQEACQVQTKYLLWPIKRKVSFPGAIGWDRLPERLQHHLSLQALRKCSRSTQTETQDFPMKPQSPPTPTKPRHEDVSQSVGETIKRYLRMARRRPSAAKLFTSCNYDRIVTPSRALDTDRDKGTQTEQIVPSPEEKEKVIKKTREKDREMDNAIQLVHKSKSSGNVGPLLSRRIWRGRSKSQTRPCAEIQPTKAKWTPQGKGVWSSSEGRRIELKEVDMQELTPIERKILQRVASAKLQELNFGAIVVPLEDGATPVEVKPKRRALLLKRKALTTGFFDASKKEDTRSQGGSFGQTLEQCLANEMRALSRCTVTHVRAGSCESLPQRAQESTAPIGESLSQQDLRTDPSAPTVPAIVRQCIAHLRAHGLCTVGIFRVSPARRRVRNLREEWERAGPNGVNLDATHCPHDVATLLKEFLRDLPEPLLCSALYTTFLGTQRIRNRRLQLEAIAHLLRLLPLAHRDTLRALLQFLAEVARAANDAPNGRSGNRMDSTNLATVFAPNILRSSEDRVEERLDAINVIRTMIDHNDELFNVPAAILDEVYSEMMDQHGQALDRLCERRSAEGATRSGTDDERRRMSSPLVFHGSGILSATLSIPVTVAPLHVGDHLEGIPYIEEQTPQETRGPQRPLATVTGTLSLAPSPSAPNTDPVFFPDHRVMRSKTEDFDRPQRPRIPPSDGRRSQMVYKRREIISSAQSGKK